MITVQGTDDQNNIVPLLTTRRMFVVTTEADRLTLANIPETVLVVNDDQGNKLSDWTPRLGLGDWDFLLNHTRIPISIFIILPAHVVVDDKAKKFLAALTRKIEAYSVPVCVPELIPGSTLSDDLTDAGSITALIDRWFDAAAVGTSNGDTAAEQLFNMVHDEFNFYTTPDHVPFLVKKDGPKYVWLTTKGSHPDLRDYMVATFLDKTGVVAPRGEVSDALSAIEAKCAATPVTQHLAVRGARSAVSNDYWIDLGREDGQVIRLDPNGWSVESEPDKDVFFHRTSVVKELPVPVYVGEKDAKQTIKSLLRPFVNATDADWPLYVAWMAVHLVPGWVAPIALLVSEADAGKSTACMAIRHAVEGVMEKGSKMGAKEDDLLVTMSSSRVSVFNNITKISSTQSDTLCQVIDGLTYSKRRLFTDAGTSILKINPSILMNGITTGKLKGDLKTRSVKMELSSTLYGERMSDPDIERQLIDQHPVVLGALLTVACQVLRLVDGIIVPKPEPRMIDYARVLVALGEAWGLGLEPFNRYNALMDEMSAEVTEDLLFQVLHRAAVTDENLDAECGIYRMEFTLDWLKDAFNAANTQKYIGSVGMLDNKRGYDDTHAMSTELRRLDPDWKRLGVTVERIGQRRVYGTKYTYYVAEFTPGPDTPWPTHTDVVMRSAG